MGVLSRKRDPDPYGDNVDLHHLWRWSMGIETLLEEYKDRHENDWMVFRPDNFMRDALTRFRIKYPDIIRKIDDCLDRVEKQYTEFSSDAYAGYAPSAKKLVPVMEALLQNIQRAVEVIAGSEAKPGGEGG